MKVKKVKVKFCALKNIYIAKTEDKAQREDHISSMSDR